MISSKKPPLNLKSKPFSVAFCSTQTSILQGKWLSSQETAITQPPGHPHLNLTRAASAFTSPLSPDPGLHEHTSVQKAQGHGCKSLYCTEGQAYAYNQVMLDAAHLLPCPFPAGEGSLHQWVLVEMCWGNVTSLTPSVGGNWHSHMDLEGALGAGCTSVISSINKRGENDK